MSVSRDIVASYRDPAPVLRRRAADGPREDRALAILMVACLLIFVSQWPRLAREAYFEPEIPFDARLGGTLLAWIFIVPLVLYLLGALSHMVLRIFGASGSWYDARLALFWALLAAAPLWLLNGLVAGFIGPGLQQSIVGAVGFFAFIALWFRGLWALEFKGKPAP